MTVRELRSTGPFYLSQSTIDALHPAIATLIQDSDVIVEDLMEQHNAITKIRKAAKTDLKVKDL